MGARTLAAVGHGGLEPRGGGVSQQKLPESGAAAIEVFHWKMRYCELMNKYNKKGKRGTYRSMDPRVGTMDPCWGFGRRGGFCGMVVVSVSSLSQTYGTAPENNLIILQTHFLLHHNP